MPNCIGLNERYGLAVVPLPRAEVPPASMRVAFDTVEDNAALKGPASTVNPRFEARPPTDAVSYSASLKLVLFEEVMFRPLPLPSACNPASLSVVLPLKACVRVLAMLARLALLPVVTTVGATFKPSAVRITVCWRRSECGYGGNSALVCELMLKCRWATR